MAKQDCRVILIVDDDAECRDYVAGALGKRYSLLFADNGADGLAIARRSRPDLVLLDVMMPGGEDGLQVLCALKQSAETKDIPVIMLTGVNAVTGLAFDKDILGAYLGAPEAFLEKPPDLAVLKSTVSRILGD